MENLFICELAYTPIFLLSSLRLMGKEAYCWITSCRNSGELVESEVTSCLKCSWK